MLTIREPISLKIQKPIQSIRQDLAERMQANYGLMSLPIRKEELLHITSEPPEVYFGEGDTFQIFNDIKSENQQELRLDVINNVINRILVAQTENFTYQDTVYISSILRKLGIRDEKLFMKQVFALQQEQKETNQLLQQYEQHQALLQNLFLQEKQERQAAGEKTEVPAASTQRYYMHDEIFNRLQTGKIYQDMRAYTKGIRHESQQIFRNELSIGEQAALTKQFHLHAFKQKLLQMDTPLLYFHQNQYEFLQETLEELSQTTEEQISAAVLLNLLDQSYALRQQQIEQNSHNWYSVAGALFRTAENTWKRYEANLLERRYISEQLLQVWENVHTVKQQEGDMIQRIAQEYHTLAQQFRNTTEQTQLMQQTRIEEDNRQEISLSGGSFHLTQEALQLQYLEQETAEEEAEETAAMTVKQLQQQLEMFQQKNYENYQKLTEIERQQPKLKERRADRKKAQQDALRALENPAEVLQEFFATEVHDSVQETKRETESKIYALFSEETREIYRQYLQQNSTQADVFLQQLMQNPTELQYRQEEVQNLQFMTEEAERELETQLYERFSERTREVYHQFQQEAHTQETTFLEHILRQPAQVEVREEVLTILQEIARQPLPVKQAAPKAEQSIEQREILQQPVIHQALRQQMQFLREIQTAPVYQQWTQPETLYLQVKQETEEAVYQQVQREQEQISRKQERILHTEAESITEKVKAAERLLLQPKTADSIEENVVTKAEYMRLQQREKQFTELQQSVERNIRRQQQEKLAELATTQREQQFRQIDFVHKQEEQLLNEELMETIRTQQQHIRKEEHTQEQVLQQERSTQTMVQNAVNHIQVQQMENIEELIQQNVKKQLGNLSEQVYGKIEKKLETERKRRGYR